MNRIQFTGKALPLLMLLCVGLIATGLATFQTKRNIESAAEKAFVFSADQLALVVEERLISHEMLLRGAAAFFRGSTNVARSEWRDYVVQLDAESIVPGMQGIGFAKVIAPSELANHETSIRSEGFPDYAVRPAGAREVYSAIIYLEPFEGRNLRAFGFDMYSEPVRRAAMERARDTGDVALSGKVVLVQETGQEVQPGTLMYLPVYDPEKPTQTIEQRRTALLGWVYSPFRMYDLMEGVLAGRNTLEGRYVGMTIYDGSAVDNDALLFSGDSRGTRHAKQLNYQRIIDFHGTRWLLDFNRLDSAPGLDYSLAWLIAIGGALVNLLLYGLALSLLATRDRANKIAHDLTDDIRQREHQLKESEFRWHFAIEGSGDGLWDWNIPEHWVYFSPRWKAMLGYADHEIGESLDEWEKRIHPDDLAATMATVQDYLEGRSSTYLSEHRVRCKDGSYIWMMDRGSVVSRDEIGQPTRMIGIHTDINKRKLLEKSLRRTASDLKDAQRIARMGSWKLHFPEGRLEYTDEVHRMFGFDSSQPRPDFAGLEPMYTPKSWRNLNAAVSLAREHGTPYELELEIAKVGGRRGWMLARGEAKRDSSGVIIGLRGTAFDITARVESRIRIEHLGKLYAALSECNWAIIHCGTPSELLQQICEVVVHSGGMKMAWIGLTNAADGRIRPVHSFGEGLDYLDGLEVSIHADDAHGQGPAGIATRENRAVWVDNFQTDQLTSPWHDRGSRFGWAASAAIPIRRSNQTIGALTMYSMESGWFDLDTRTLLEEIGSNVSYALDKLDAEAEADIYRASQIEAEQRFRSLVEQSIAGAFIIQDGVIAYANPRMGAILGYESVDSLQGHSMLDLVSERDREHVKSLLDRLSAGEKSSEAVLFSAIKQNGDPVEVGINTSMASYKSQPAIIGLMQDISDRKMAEDQIRRYATQLEHTFMQTVGLANTLSEMRDPYTAGHERRVAEIAVAIAREMGFDENRLEGLRVGGYLHDVGKMVVPAEILSKPTRLSAAEYELIKGHPRAGFDILKEVDFPWPVAQIAYQHHERIDGTGYPQGLKGNEIIIEARIVAVADVVESMASHRPYRAGLGIEKALAEIESGIGTKFDTEVATTCLRLFREKGYTLPDR